MNTLPLTDLFSSKSKLSLSLKSETMSQQILLSLYVGLFVNWRLVDSLSISPLVAWTRGQCAVRQSFGNESVFRSMETTTIYHNRLTAATPDRRWRTVQKVKACVSVLHMEIAPFQEAGEHCSSIEFMFNNPKDTVYTRIRYKYTLYTEDLIWLYKTVFVHTFSRDHDQIISKWALSAYQSILIRCGVSVCLCVKFRRERDSISLIIKQTWREWQVALSRQPPPWNKYMSKSQKNCVCCWTETLTGSVYVRHGSWSSVS